jgi:putative DNA primase/helicase
MSDNGKHIADAPPVTAPDAEAALMGCLLIDDAARTKILQTIRANDLFDLANRRIFGVVAELHAAGTPVDAVVLYEELSKRKLLEEVGGKNYIAAILGVVPSTNNAEHYARLVKDAAGLRDLADLGDRLAGAARSPRADAASVWKLAMTGITGAMDKATAVTEAEYGAQCTRLSDVVRQQVDWLWPARIPAGKLTLFFGDPGVGKSFVTMYLAARVSVEGAWPDGSGRAPLGTTIILNCEDANDDTNCPRLDAMGADTTKIISLDSIRMPGENGDVIERSFTLADVNHLADVIRRNPDTKLVTIDPVSGYLDGTDGRKNSDIRGLLAPLAKLAEEFHVAVVIVNHMNKSGGGRAIYRAMDSLAFIAAARAAWVFLEDSAEDAQDGRVLFLPAKSNLSKNKGGLAYSITEAGAVLWELGRVDRKADDVLAEAAAAGNERGRPAVEGAKAELWLAELLVDGNEHAVKDVVEQAQAEDIASERTIRRVAKKLGAISHRAVFGGGYVWRLPRPASAPLLATETDMASMNILANKGNIGQQGISA